MDAGKLNKRVLIKRQAKTSDGYGGTTSTLSTTATVWAKINEKQGKIEEKNFKRGRYLEADFIMRSKTVTENITDDALLQIQGESKYYRITEIFEHRDKYYTTITGVLID